MKYRCKDPDCGKVSEEQHLLVYTFKDHLQKPYTVKKCRYCRGNVELIEKNTMEA